MSTETLEPVDVHFTEQVLALARESGQSGEPGQAREPRGLPPGLDADTLLTYFDAQLETRHIDFAARWMRVQKTGYYSIGSAGHEANAAVAMALRPTDPALLHYRSGGFYAARSRQLGIDSCTDTLRSLAASSRDAISGGRHKVFGHHGMAVIPQTSTIASHLPRAFGVAMTLGRQDLLGLESRWSADALAVCSFGDASANHASAIGALNASSYVTHRGIRLPLLWVCEDNGIGISTRTPAGWLEASLACLPGVDYTLVDGSDPVAALLETRRIADQVRATGRPALLHLKTVRFMGHAGTDAEVAYRSRTDIARDYERDPLLGTARLLVDAGVLTPEEVVELYEDKRSHVMGLAAQMGEEPHLTSSEEVRRPLTVSRPEEVRELVRSSAAYLQGREPVVKVGARLTLAQAINAVLHETLTSHDDAFAFGEDISTKGGVYGLTRGLRKRFGEARVFDTILDEETILGTALGMAVSGWLPIPEIQYLAYVHNAIDQIRGEGATQAFFSNGDFTNGMVIRIAGLAYQKGFGGHFHNDNSVAALRDIPGVQLVVPAHPDDALELLRTSVAVARAEGRMVIFLEPIALYHSRDLHEPGDGLWTSEYAVPTTDLDARPVSARQHGDGRDLLMVTFGNGVPMSLRVARRLEEEGVQASVLDLRWLTPLPAEDMLAAVGSAQRVLVVDETRASGGVSESVLALLADHGVGAPVARVCSDDSFIPLGPAADTVLLDEERIHAAALHLMGD
ncbi:MAG: MFS transporter [Micrococcales bacterium]|nr:MFS transporter [Micrococcales bacterium]